MISGVFLSINISAEETIKKRMKQLLPPYILTSLAIIMISILKNGVGILVGKGTYSNLLHELCVWIYASFYGAGSTHEGPIKVIPIGAIWFLLALIFSSYFVRKALDYKHPGLIVAVIALLGYSSSKIVWLPWSIQAGMTASVFLYIGVVMKRQKFLERNIHAEAFEIAGILWLNEILHGWPCIGIVENQYPNGAFDFVGVPEHCVLFG